MRKPLFLIIILLFLSVPCTIAQGTEFGNNYRAAVKSARKQGKPLFVALLKHDNDLSQNMAEVLADSLVIAMYNSRFVPVLLWDNSPVADKLFEDYGFSYYPAMLFLSPEGDFLNKMAGYEDTRDMLALADDYRHEQADRLAELRRASKGHDRNALREYLELASQLGVRDMKALKRWTNKSQKDSVTFALIKDQRAEVESAPFRFVADNAAAFSHAVGGNEVDIYIYGKYFDHLKSMHSRQRKTLDNLKKKGYEYIDALTRHLALAPHIDNASEDADIREQIDRLTKEYPVTAPLIGNKLMRQVTPNNPVFEEYVAGFATRLADYSPRSAVHMALYIANNYLIVNGDVLAADPWVDRYLEWSGDPNYEPEITRTVKQATGEWPCDDYGRVMPDVALKTLDGKTMHVSDFRGEFVLIDFWASWCGPCKAEVPHVKEAYQRVKGSPVRFVSVSSDRDDKAWRKAVDEIDVPWLHLSSKGTDMLRRYKVYGIPRIMVLDPEGRLIADNITGRTIEVQLRRLAEKYGWKY